MATDRQKEDSNGSSVPYKCLLGGWIRGRRLISSLLPDGEVGNIELLGGTDGAALGGRESSLLPEGDVGASEIVGTIDGASLVGA